jgi:hypothetical protein
MTYADDLKARIISSLLPSLGFDEVLGVEVRFGDGRYRADLVIASLHRLSAIEIKGPRDNLDRLAEQAIGYKAMFLDFSVAVAPEFADAVRRIVPRETGIMIVSPDRADWVRRPAIRVRLSKVASILWLRTTDLRELLGQHNLSVSGTYEDLASRARQSLSTDTLSQFALGSIAIRLGEKYHTFVRELGRTVTLDDVRVLTLGDRITPSSD